MSASTAVAGVFPRTPPRAFRAVPLDARTRRANGCATNVGERAHPRRQRASRRAHCCTTSICRPEADRKSCSILPLANASQARPSSRHDWSRRGAVARETESRRARPCRESRSALADTLRTSLAHVLINRDGPALQPGSRAYERSWIRDGAHDLGDAAASRPRKDVAKEFLRWYAPLSVRERQGAVLRRSARRRSRAGERQSPANSCS